MSAANFKPSEAVDAVKETTRTMDELSHDGFGRIKGLASLALQALETPEAYRSVEALAAALATICEIADDTKSAINGEAGSVGCGYMDPAWRRRADARRAFHDSQREGVAA